jgi:hypothetical protein
VSICTNSPSFVTGSSAGNLADVVADVVADEVVDVVVPNQPVADADVADSRGDGQPLRPWRREPWTRFGPSPLNKWEATQVMVETGYLIDDAQ